MGLRTLLTAILTAGMLSQVTEAQTPLPLDIERVSERVLVMSPLTGNSRIVVLNTRAGLVMLNTGWSPTFTRRLKVEAEQAFGRTDWYGVIVTSEEFLGNGGIGVFPGATVIAQEGFRDYLQAHRDDMDDILAARRSEFQDRVTRTRGMLDTLRADPERRRGLETWLGLCRTIADDLEGGFPIPFPDRTFSDRLSLDLGDLTVECLSFGGTPEQGSVMIRVPEENLIWLGDVFHAAHVLPYGGYSDAPPDLEGWLAVLDELLSGDRETMKVFRANGEDRWTWRQVGDRRRLIADIRDAVQEARRRGDSLDSLLGRLSDTATAFPYVRTWSGTMIELVSEDIRRTVEELWRFEVSASSGSFTDTRDGATYRWVRLGNQVWTAENLRFDAGEGCWAWNNDETTVAERGRYYDWAAARRAAPPGWHLPSDEEWKELEMFLGLSREETDRTGERGASDRVLAGRLKAPGRWPTEYQGRSVPVTGETGFSALPIGWRAQEQFFHEGYTGFWSGSEVGDQAWMRGLHFFDDTITRVLNSKVFAFSVRCVRDH